MRRNSTLALFALTLVFASSAFADDSAVDKTIGYYMKTHEAPQWRNWIVGIGVGFWVANKELINSKRDPLFCFTGTYQPEPRAVLDAWIAKDRASCGAIKAGEYFADGLDVEVAMLIAYEDAFSCGAKGK
jgi:hypothetical protein